MLFFYPWMQYLRRESDPIEGALECRMVSTTSNQIKSNHFYCHITTAQVPWWVKFLWACSRQCKKTTDNLPMDRQCKKTTNNLPMDRQCKKTTDNLPMDRQCKKTTNNLPMDRQCKKTTNNLPMDRQCKKTTNNLHMDRQCKKNNSNLHMDRQCGWETWVYELGPLRSQAHSFHRSGWGWNIEHPAWDRRSLLTGSSRGEEPYSARPPRGNEK